MTSPDKKIRQKGWEFNTTWKEARQKINRYLDEEVERPTKRRRNKKFCKPLRGPHNMVEVRRTEMTWLGKGFWVTLECSACGRKDFKTEKAL